MENDKVSNMHLQYCFFIKLHLALVITSEKLYKPICKVIYENFEKNVGTILSFIFYKLKKRF